MILVFECRTINGKVENTLYDVGTDLESIMSNLSSCRDLSATYYFYRGGNLIHPFMIIKPLED